MKRYHHLFFDLDHTLWDFRTNSRTVLHGLHAELGLAHRGIPSVDVFTTAYEEINEGLWKRYESGKLPRDVMRVLRFRNTLLVFGVKDEDLAHHMGHEYLQRTPRMNGLLPGTMELLNDLRGRYKLHVITNGFHLTQATKLTCAGLTGFFEQVVSSESAGIGKPDPRIFHKAMGHAGTTAQESLMIGDSITADMAGARSVGMDHAHFAPEGGADPLATYRLLRLDDLRPLLL